MTGFEFTAVRAAIMGAAVLLAKLIGRIYDPRNIIVLAALVINLFNPKVLVFDLGFQLSFLAVLGLIYLLPALRKLLKFKEGPGFLAWRENFLMTLSAQLATAPLLMINFGNFSPGALIANILILLAIPLTMILGFLIGFFYFLSYYLALILGWLAALLLNYEIFVIELFAKIALPFNPTLNFWGILAYYLILIGLIVWAKKSGKISL
jgi:competence protein ComEC